MMAGAMCLYYTAVTRTPAADPGAVARCSDMLNDIRAQLVHPSVERAAYEYALSAVQSGNTSAIDMARHINARVDAATRGL